MNIVVNQNEDQATLDEDRDEVWSYVKKVFGDDPNKKVGITEILNNLPEKLGRDFVKRCNLTFGTVSGNMACYDCMKAGRFETE